MANKKLFFPVDLDFSMIATNTLPSCSLIHIHNILVLIKNRKQELYFRDFCV